MSLLMLMVTAATFGLVVHLLTKRTARKTTGRKPADPAARRKRETEDGFLTRIKALRDLGLVDDDPQASRTQQVLRREGAVTAVAVAVVGGVAWVTSSYGWVAWSAVAVALLAVRPARWVLGWTKPRRDSIIPAAAGPRGWWERARPGALARGTAARLKQRWLPLCREARWTRGNGDAERAPSLLYCRAEGRDTIALAWRPWINDAEGSWAKQAEVVKQAIGAQTVRWWQHPEDSGVLEVRIGIQPLPRRVELTDPPPPATPDEHLQVYIGPRAGGGQSVWRPIDSPHIFINGETNGGKGVILRLILSQVVPRCRGVVINPKGAGEFAWMEHAPNWGTVEIPPIAGDATEDQVAAALDELRRRIVAALQQVSSEFVRRQALIRKHGVDRWCDLPPSIRPLPFFVIFDEVAEAVGGDDDEDTQRMGTLLARLARLARSAGIFLVLAAQRGDVANLGPQGGQLRSNLTGFMAVGGIDKPGLGMLTRGRVTADVGALSQGIKGRALAARLDSEGAADVCVVQVAYLSQETAARAVGARLSGHGAEVVAALSGSEHPTAPRRGAGGVGSVSEETDTESDIVSGRGGAAPTARAGGDGAEEARLGAQASAAPETGGAPATPGPVEPQAEPTTAEDGEPADGGAAVVSLKEAADRLGCTPDAVRKRAARGAGVQYVARGKVRITA